MNEYDMQLRIVLIRKTGAQPKPPVFLLPLWLQYLHNVSNVTAARTLDLKRNSTRLLPACHWAVQAE